MVDPFPDFPAPRIPELDIRFTVEFDGPKLRQMLADPETIQWYPFSEGNELEEAIKLWMSFSLYRLSLTAVLDQQVVGMAVLLPLPYKKMAHQTAFYLVVHPQRRRQGIGSSLLRNLMHLAKERFHLEFIHAEVYQGCPILPLLERAGFQTCFLQADYITADRQLLSRRIMQRPLKGLAVTIDQRRDG